MNPLTQYLESHRLNVPDLRYVIEQGISIEKLAMESHRITNAEEMAIEAECRILQAEVLLSLLRLSSLSL